ncbi:CDC48 family AAA ATPase [Methanococcoides methylutens]|uniref:Cell division protein FtsH n=1 Tax=Methanococcoides methylutens MM1 TaxID=1434104 RepID=A0A0E3SQA4_METMT|nr:CDC48 family AAA ATPase [Methanococcoides methylutens]AKB84791.1 Cell division protein FtsH [Methanococcoides methylutens MM1]
MPMSVEKGNSNGDSVKLKVAEASQEDVGKGIVRLDPTYRDKLEVGEYGVLEIEGGRVTSALAINTDPSDAGLDIIRMDGLIRANAKISIGDYVEVRKAEWKEAINVTLAPVSKGMHISASSNILASVFRNRTVSKGDFISTTHFRRSKEKQPARGMMLEDMFSDLFDYSFGLGEIKMQVTATNPKGIVKITDMTELQLLPEAVELPPEQSIPTVMYEDLGGIKPAISKVREMIELPLKHPELFDRLGIEPPRGVLLHGPPGTGKTMLARAVANESDAYFISVNGPEIMSKYYGESEHQIREIFDEAEQNAPAIIFLDEIDSIAPKRAEVTGEVERRVVSQLLSLMDGLKERKNVIVIGATNRPEALDMALRRPGRFDREIVLHVPDQDGRLEIFQIHTRGMPLADDVDLNTLAGTTYGFVGADIAALCREAAMGSLRRILPQINLEEEHIPEDILEKLSVTAEDFKLAQKDVEPSAMREIMIETPNVGWNDVGGLEGVKELLKEAVEWPLKNPESFQRIGVEAPKGVLLYGPPGTGKTMLAKAIAHESNANFIAAKGSDLLSKWYGESEKHISEMFSRARQVSPSIVFLDELDALAPIRGSAMGEPQVTERIVNQLLSELDGLEELHGVVIIGATNRPDIIDPALIRPGRFDELILVPVPDLPTRRKIFEVHTRKMSLADDVNIEELLVSTDKYTGADIAAVCKKAGRFALREDLLAKEVSQKHFLKAIDETGASVTSDTMKYYEDLKGDLKTKRSREIESPVYA